MRDLLVKALVLVILGGVLGATGNALRKDGLSVATFAPPTTCSTGELGAFGDVAEVEVIRQSDASALCEDPATLIVDARSAAAFARGHIAGALHLPCSASEGVALAAENALGKKTLLIVYGDSNEDALEVAEQMRRRLGRADLRIGVLDGGFAAWSAAGLACSSGACPQCGAPEHAEHGHE